MSLPRRFQVVCEVPFARAVVWEVLSHTDHLNRHVGLSPVIYGDWVVGKSGSYREAASRLAGLKVAWREFPFQWEHGNRYSVLRLYEKGPIQSFEGGVELADGDDAHSTRVTFFADIAARGAVGGILVPLIARKFLNQSLQFCNRTFAPDAQPRSSAPLPSRDSVDEPVLQRLTQELATRVAPEYAHALAEQLRVAGDDEVSALRPFAWADENGLARKEALRACLHGVKIGMLNLRWSMMCPNCRVAKVETAALNELSSSVHCDMCGVSYDISFDRYVELKFAVHSSIRAASSDIFCIGGPFRAPHILVQKRLEAGGRAWFTLPPGNAPLRLRVLRWNLALDVSPDAPRKMRVELHSDGWSDGQHYISGARGPFEVLNHLDEEVTVVLERTEWDESAVTAAFVTALQEFRSLFSSEVLRPGRQMAVENVTLFFSDLSNSTALYEQIGDAPAFGRVGSHFDWVSGHIADNNGAVVKTMGDAVMAVFHKSDDAVRAALQIQRYFGFFRETLSGASEINLKIGLHCGPALAVNSNERLDYFGRTVNIAARVAAQSNAGDFVLSEALWSRPEVRILCADADVTHFQAKLRGVADDFELVRVRPKQSTQQNPGIE